VTKFVTESTTVPCFKLRYRRKNGQNCIRWSRNWKPEKSKKRK